MNNQVTFISNEFIIIFYQNLMNSFNLFCFCKYHFWKKIQAISVKLFVQSPGQFFITVWNLVTKTYRKFTALQNFENIKNDWKKLYGFWKINNFVWNEKKEWVLMQVSDSFGMKMIQCDFVWMRNLFPNHSEPSPFECATESFGLSP